jgi:hypothetical protein
MLDDAGEHSDGRTEGGVDGAGSALAADNSVVLHPVPGEGDEGRSDSTCIVSVCRDL